jgi:hypothetical protein
MCKSILAAIPDLCVTFGGDASTLGKSKGLQREEIRTPKTTELKNNKRRVYKKNCVGKSFYVGLYL